MVYTVVFELFSWLQKRFRSSARKSAPDTMTNIAQEATASSSGNKALHAQIAMPKHDITMASKHRPNANEVEAGSDQEGAYEEAIYSAYRNTIGM